MGAQSYAQIVRSERGVRDWARAVRSDWFTGVLLAGFAALRLGAGLGQAPAVYPDSASYFDVRVWGGLRLPIVTVWYSIVSNHRAIVNVQVLTAVVCWSIAAVVMGSVVERVGVRRVLRAAVLLVGLSPAVTTWDSVILSESTAISLTVVFTAVGLRFACRPTRAMAGAVLVTGSLWALTRTSNAVLIFVVCVAMVAVGSGRGFRRLVWPVAIGLVLVATAALVASDTREIQDYNSASIVVRRVLADPDRLVWFEAEGMPERAAEIATPPFPEGIGDPAVALRADRRFHRWLRDQFPEVYARYLLEHPGYTLDTPFTHEGALPGLATGVAAYGASEQVLPQIVVDTLWPRDGLDQLLLGLGAVAVCVAAAVGAWTSRSRRRALGGASVVLVATLADVVFVTHSAGWEHERLMTPVAVAFRLAILWLAASLASELSLDDAGPRVGEGFTTHEPTGSPGPELLHRGDPHIGPAARPALHTDPDRVEPDNAGGVPMGPVPDRSGTS